MNPGYLLTAANHWLEDIRRDRPGTVILPRMRSILGGIFIFPLELGSISERARLFPIHTEFA